MWKVKFQIHNLPKLMHQVHDWIRDSNPGIRDTSAQVLNLLHSTSPKFPSISAICGLWTAPPLGAHLPSRVCCWPHIRLDQLFTLQNEKSAPWGPYQLPITLSSFSPAVLLEVPPLLPWSFPSWHSTQHSFRTRTVPISAWCPGSHTSQNVSCLHHSFMDSTPQRLYP